VGSYLFQRVLRDGKDSRFDEIKKSPPRFLAAWVGQATWVSLCLMPVIAVNATPAAAFAALPKFSPTDLLGAALFLGGFLFEITADRQKSAWVEEKRTKQHEELFMTRGLWSKRCVPYLFLPLPLRY
jgi:steroid 5-alpha reductase family enzyme